MFRKTFLILLTAFVIQFLISCGNCGPSPSFQMVHTDLSLTAGAVADKQFEVIEDTVRKESFRLEISLIDEEEQLAQTIDVLNIGFSTAQALDCPPPSYTYQDKVQSVNITMINQADASQSQDVTDLFVSKGESATYSVSELIDMPYEERGQFLLFLSMLEYDSIYKNAIFEVTVTLESGKSFTQETEEIIFID